MDLAASISPDNASLDLSVVIPVYNEVDNLAPLQAELLAALGPLGRPYEIIYVNDGSRDGSGAEMARLAAECPQVVAIDLRRNFGQTAALAAGIDHSRGEIIVLMDADMQNDPADIPLLLKTLEQGYDLVSGWRRKRQDNAIRRIPSVIANSLISAVTGVRLHDYGCTLKAYRREIMNEVRLYGEMHRFIPVFASAAGAHISEQVVNHRPRVRGRSKYGLWRTFKVILDLMTVKFLLTYRTTPMYLFGAVGLLLMTLGALTIGAALIYRATAGIYLIQTPLPSLAVTLFTLGVQSILLGLTTELLVRTYYESQAKPTYVVRRVVTSAAQPGTDTHP